MKSKFISLFISLSFILMLGAISKASNNFIQQEEVTEITIIGKITDSYTKNPLAGVTIQLRGTKTSVTSQKDGTYSITVPLDSGTLVLSYMGYQTLIININKRDKIDVSMSQEVDDPSGLW